MVEPKWVLFDVGVVLLDWPVSSRRAAQFLDVEYDKLMKNIAAVAPAMNIGKVDPLTGWATILENIGVKEDPQKVIDIWCSAQYWNKGTLEILKKIRETYHIGLFTNSWLQLRSRLESRMLPLTIDSIEALFDSSEIGFQKPSNEIFQFVEDILSIEPARILLIDDDARNTRAAERHGWSTFLYHSSPDNGKKANEMILDLLYK